MNWEDRRPILIWSIAIAVAQCLGAGWADWFEHHQVGPISSVGFIGWLLGLGAGAFVGVLLSTWRSRTPVRSIAFASAWFVITLLAGYVALVVGLVLAQATI